jgi:glycosidase
MAERDCGTELWFLGAADSVLVRGDFNGWGETSLQEVEPQVWWARLELAAGDYGYLIEVDGEEQLDPFAALTRWDANRQQELGLLRVEDCSGPALKIRSLTVEEDSVQLEAEFLEGESRVELVEASLDGELVAIEQQGEQLRLEQSSLEAGKHTLLLKVTDKAGKQAQARVPFWVEEREFSWEGAVIYEVMVDRFGEGLIVSEPGARAGGTLKGVTEKLTEGFFSDLGVDAIWLSPLNEGPEGFWEGKDGHQYQNYHGYWPISPDTIEPALGTSEDFKTLVAKAHRQGIRVLLDIVPNHIHQDHPYRQNPGWIHENPDCICGDYSCPWESSIQQCWFASYLPDLAQENPETVQQLVADWLQWALDYELDGFRVDAVPMMPRSAIRELQYGIRQTFAAGAPFYTLGETFTGMSDQDSIRYNLGPHGLSGQFDFPAMWAIRSFLVWGSLDAAGMEAVFAESEAAWEGSGAVMGQFIGNHDTTRFLSEAAGSDLSDPWNNPPQAPNTALPYQKTLLAHVLTVALVGAVVLWQGDEYGQPGANDPDNRRPWRSDYSEEEAALLYNLQKLLKTRHCSPALQYGARTPLVASGSLWASLRQTESDTALIVVNAGDSSARLSSAEAFGLTELWSGDVLKDAIIEIPPESSKIFTSCSGATP